ncbi:MAG: calcium/sodium antiporter [Firmicutes bacterium]|nr:calcium/sodium antiporter [Bacillota bacterium]
MSIILLILGFFFLVKGADYFVGGCSKVARAIGIPSLIVGLTIVAFGTSAPEAAVSTIASLSGKNAIALGNVVGSNICNLLLVLGCAGLFGELTCEKKVISRDMVYSLFSYVVLIILSAGFFINGKTTGVITRTNGLILLCFLAIYIYALLGDAKKSIKKKEEKESFRIVDIFFILIGLCGIIGGGQLVVTSATKIASILGVSDNVIALTVVAIGTSLPELVTSVIAVRKGETDIAIGNVIGSNIFNCFFILGLASTVSPVTFGFNSFIDMIIMFIIGIIVLILTLKNMKIGKKKGILMLSLYVIYTIYILIR